MWDERQVASLLAGAVGESDALEFKQELPGRSDRDRHEFLKDVTAMANASGGTILYGIIEANGAAEALSGLKLGNADELKLRLTQLIQSGIEPRLPSFQFDHVNMNDGDVLCLEIAESFDGPHRFTVNGQSKFVRRQGSGVSELSYDQLRAAFDKTSNRLQHIRDAWELDFGMSEAWRSIENGPLCVVRLSPLISADGAQIIDPKKAYDNWMSLMLSGWGGASFAYNYHGLAVYPGGDDSILRSFVQCFRTGAFAAYYSAKAHWSDETSMSAGAIAGFVVEATDRMKKCAKLNNIGGAAILNVGLRRLAGYDFISRSRYGGSARRTSPRDVVNTTALWISDLADETVTAAQLVRPSLDLIWQTYGYSACSEYDEQGQLRPD